MKAIPSRPRRQSKCVLDVNEISMEEFTELLRKECSSCHTGFGKVINIMRKTGKGLRSEWSTPHKGETKDKFLDECFSDYWTHGNEVLKLCNGGSPLDTVASYLANGLKGAAATTITMDAGQGFAFSLLVALTVEMLLDTTCEVTLGSDVEGICEHVINKYAPQELQDYAEKSSDCCSGFLSRCCRKTRKNTPLHDGHKRTIRFLKARAAKMDAHRKAGLRYRRRILQRLCSETLQARYSRGA